MKKREFIKQWCDYRRQSLRAELKGSPHFGSLMIVNTMDDAKTAAKLWRKYRLTFKQYASLADFHAAVADRKAAVK